MKELITIGICDDDEKAIDSLYELVIKIMDELDTRVRVKTYSSGFDFLNDSEAVDILFLDEEMPGMSGLQVKEAVEESNREVYIIYVTSHDEIMAEAFGRNVCGFLMKPVGEHVLKIKIAKVLELWDDANQIMYIGAEEQYVRDYFISGESILGRTDMEGALSDINNDNFIRCHRSWIVNLKYVDKVDTGMKNFIMKDGRIIPISRREKDKVKNAYLNYVEIKMKLVLGKG